MITKDNFIIMAMRAYDNPSCKTLIEFESDVAKFTNLIRLSARDVGPIETHLLLNQVLTLLNIFSAEICIEMMFFKVRKEDWYKLKTILVYLNRMPDYIQNANINTKDIELCKEMMDTLGKI